MNHLKILCVSDVHARNEAIEWIKELIESHKPHLVLIAGDITHRGPLSFAKEFIQAIRSKETPFLAVHGNIDPPEVKEFLEEIEASIHARKKEFKGIEFAGFGGSTQTPVFTPSVYSEEEIGKTLNELVGEKTFLVTHCPPFGTKADEVMNGVHVGSHSIRKVIEEKKPIACVCGHVHETTGVQEIGETKVIKLKPFKEGNAALIELPKIKVEYVNAIK